MNADLGVFVLFLLFCIRPTPNTKMSVTETYRPIWNFNFLVRVKVSRMIRDKAAYDDCSLTSEFARVIRDKAADDERSLTSESRE